MEQKEIIELNSQTKYPKILSLWNRDEKFKVVPGSLNKKLEGLKNIKRFLLSEKYHGSNLAAVITPDKQVFLRKRSAIIAQYNTTFTLKDEKPEHSWNYFDKPNNIKQYIDCVKNVNFNRILKYFEDSKSLITIFGEGVGKKMQKEGSTYTTDSDFIVFDVKCGNSFFDWRDIIDFCKETGLRQVNWENFKGDILKFDWKKELIKRNKKRFFEGFVVRSEPPMLNQFGMRMLFKIKMEDFKTEAEKNNWEKKKDK